MKKTQWLLENSMKRQACISIVLLTVLFALVRADDSWKLYDDSEVAVVQIEIDTSALQWIYEHPWSDSLHRARMQYQNANINEWVEDIGFRIRGNTSRDAAKKSFKVSFNTFVPGRQFYDVDKLNLNGEHNDPSIIRSKLCWDFFQKIGFRASRACHAAVFINGAYHGLYISVEHIDDEFVENHFPDGTGNLWKCLYPADLTYRGDDPTAYYPYEDEERPYELKTNEEAYDYSKLARLIDVINNTPDGDLTEELENILCVPEVLKYFAANVLVGGWDDYWFLMNNYYLYHEPSVDKFHWIPYDYDNTFGVDWFDTEWARINPYTFAIIDGGPRPLATRLMATEEYRNLYTHFLEFYNERVFQWSLWEAELYDLRDKIAPWAEIDEYRRMDYGFDEDGGLDDFLNSYDVPGYSDRHVTQSIKTFVITRTASLPGQLFYTTASPTIYDVTHWPLEPGPADSITIYASAFGEEGLVHVQVFLRYEGQSPFLSPMAYSPVSGTQRVEEADRYSCTVAPLSVGQTLSFFVEAFEPSGQSTIQPRSGFLEIHSVGVSLDGLKVNEFMAKNEATIVDEFGEYEDWVEIYNPTPSDVILSGMYLTDTPEHLTKWQFPLGGVLVEAGGYVLVWCDDDEEQGPLHANFKLDGDGESVALVAGDGMTIIDSVTFGPQSDDISYGRYPDGSGSWMFLPNPTPAGSNTAPSNVPPVITATSHDPNRPHLTDTVTVTSKVTDERGLLSVMLSYDTGAGYQNVRMWDDGAHGDSVAGDSIYGGCIPPQANETLVHYFVSAEDDVGAITTDPADAPATTYSYTVGYSAPPIFINEFMADNDNSVQDEAGEYDDWFELYHAGDFEVSLGGLFLTDDLTEPTKWSIPDTVIGGGEVLLFWADEDGEQGPLHADFKLSKGGEEIGLFDGDGITIIDSVTFGPQTTDVSSGRYPDGGDQWQFFEVSTPGERNAQLEKGDVTEDGRINVLDVLTVINHILAIQPLTGDALLLADCNADGQINVVDALGIVNVILGTGVCEP
jgi:hypothetical protein